MDRIEVGPGDASVIWLGRGLLAEAGERLISPSGRFFLISPLSAAAVAQRVGAALGGRVFGTFEMDDREESKTLQGVERVADAALEAGVRRDDALLAVGGGVVSDVVGLTAAVLLRGVAWNAIPTTTGGMSDAAIGGKTGVDHRRGKNLLGAFHPPRTILIDPAAASTLPDRDYRAGLVEAVKAAWTADASLAARAEVCLERALDRDEGALLELVGGAARIKASLVSEDPRDSGRRRILNFGHTLGHAIEAAGGYRALRHGEAVAWGIAAALEISRRRAGLSPEEAGSVRRVLARLGPFPDPTRAPDLLEPYLERDKKRTNRGSPGVLLEAIGRARVEEDIPILEWLEAAAIMSLS